MKPNKIILIGIILLVATTASAATYYIDFEGGKDSSDGLSTGTAWKHSPGDPNATGKVVTTALQGGDTVLFKGGIVYKGSISAKYSGLQGNPIRYKGNGWGSEKAIIDGATPITGWVRCSSQSACAGSPYWQNIFLATIPSLPAWMATSPALSINLFLDDQILAPAQFPASENPLYQTKTNYYSVSPSAVTSTSLSDVRLAGLGGTDLVGSYAYLWVNPNEITARKISSYNEATKTITFVAAQVYTDKNTLFSLANSPLATIFNKPGQYYFNETPNANGEYTLYVWPPNNMDISSNGTVTRSVLFGGIDVSGSFINVEGFRMQKQAGPVYGAGAGIYKSASGRTTDVTIKDNEITMSFGLEYASVFMPATDNLTVEDNYIHDTRGALKGIQGGGTNTVFQNNRLERVAGTPLYFPGVTTGRITGNIVADSRGVHANGITVYQNSSDITISNNIVRNVTIALALQNSRNLNIYNNVFDGVNASEAVVSSWSGITGTNYFLNNVVIGSANNNALSLGGGPFIVKNNVIGGGGIADVNRSNNIYTSLTWWQQGRYGWQLLTGEFSEPGLFKIFIDVANGDYKLKQESPAIEAGANLSEYFSTDMGGRARPPSGAWDIGAYEYVSGSAPPSANQSPIVSITNPTNGAAFNTPATITLDATASDSDGTVSKVEFYSGAVLLNTDSTAPYSYTWNNVAAGTYSLTAKATDNQGATATSNATSIIVSTQGAQLSDDDLDGVPNLIDHCPKTAGTARPHVNIFGCAIPIADKFDVKPDFNATDINGVQNLELGISQYGKISYANKNILLVKTTAQNEDERLNIDADLNITQGKITLNQSNLPQLSAPAGITLYNTSFTNPKILKDGAVCTQCAIVSYDKSSGTLAFSVPGF